MDGSNNFSVSGPAPQKKFLVLTALEEQFRNGSNSGLHYYIIYARKNSYRQAQSGRALFALNLLNQSFHVALREGGPKVALAMAPSYIRLLTLLVGRQIYGTFAKRAGA